MTTITRSQARFLALFAASIQACASPSNNDSGPVTNDSGVADVVGANDSAARADSPRTDVPIIDTGMHDSATTDTGMVQHDSSRPPSDAAPPPGCAAAGPVGHWENITPQQLHPDQWCVPAGNSVCPGAGNVTLAQVLGGYSGAIATYGAHYFATDPSTPGTVYLGTSSLGVWKTADCGANWTHIDTGQGGAALDDGRNWSIVVDPTNPSVLYTVAGYGAEGLYRSTDAGVNWTQILTANVLGVTGNGFVEKITMDPTDHSHLLLSFHTSCTGTPLPGAAMDGDGNWGCMAESMNADANTPTWTLTTAGEPWAGSDGPGQTMVDRTTWYYGSNGDGGLWRTTTGGVSVSGQRAWTQVFPGATIGGVYLASDGSIYSGGYGGTLSRSMTGDLNSWTSVATDISMTSVNGSIAITDDGTTLYVSKGAYGPAYLRAPLNAPTGFTNLPSTPAGVMQGGSNLAFDSVSHILYSSNMSDGFWRYRTE